MYSDAEKIYLVQTHQKVRTATQKYFLCVIIRQRVVGLTLFADFPPRRIVLWNLAAWASYHL